MIFSIFEFSSWLLTATAFSLRKRCSGALLDMILYLHTHIYIYIKEVAKGKEETCFEWCAQSSYLHTYMLGSGSKIIFILWLSFRHIALSTRVQVQPPFWVAKKPAVPPRYSLLLRKILCWWWVNQHNQHDMHVRLPIVVIMVTNMAKRLRDQWGSFCISISKHGL
jgi:hypothetical protein